VPTRGPGAPPLGRAWGACGAILPLASPFWQLLLLGTLRYMNFVSFNSENILYGAFLKSKTAENGNWRCVNRLVREMLKRCRNAYIIHA
jgi:hypothetical protein